MKNKGLLIKFCFTAFAFLLCGLSFTSATTTFHLTGIQGLQGLQDSVRQKIMYIHFANNGNDFGGLFYLANLSGAAYSASSTGNVGIRTNSTGYSCSIQLRGFYYNAERGERLWPLDEETMEKWQVQDRLGMSGGIYMACEPKGRSDALESCKSINSNLKEDYEICVDDVNKFYPGDGNGFYGEIEQTYSGDNFHLVVGVNYTGYDPSYKDKFITIESGSDLSPTFIRLGNQFPVGFVYDYNGGIGLAGCRIENGRDVRELVNLFYSTENSLSTLFRADNNSGLVYQGDPSLNIQCSGISLANTLSRIVIEGVVGMTDGNDEKQAQLGTYGNMSDTKMQYFATKTVTNSAMMNYVRKKAELLCRGKWTNCDSSCNSTTEKIKCCNSMNNVLTSLSEGCTYIIKDGGATIQAGKGGYDVYLLSGNLYINEISNKNDRKVFDENGFKKSVQVNAFSGAAGSAGYTGAKGAAVGVLITGNFVVNGGVKAYSGYPITTTGTLEDKYFIYGKFTTKDTFQNLEDVFAWRCLNGIGTDGNWCPDLQGKNPYSEASLVIIDQNYDSPLRQ